MSANGKLEFGIIIGDHPVSLPPHEHFDLVLRLVEAAQRNGFTYITIGQHFLYSDYRWLQPIPLMARLAGETGDDVKLVTTVLIVPLHHPVILAEELATLDIVSGGRLVVGAGTGYTHFEFDYLGIPYEERYRRFVESIALMKLLWSQDRVSFDGEFWQLDDVPTHIRPIQQPRPRLWMGAHKEPAIRRAARLGDGWIIVPEASSAEVEAGIAATADEREKHGLPPVALPLRREIVIAKDQDEAVEEYAKRARERYLAYAARENPNYDADEMRRGFREWALDRSVLGTADECLEQLQRIDPSRTSPVIVRPSWPGQPIEESIAYLDEVGEKVVSAFR